MKLIFIRHGEPNYDIDSLTEKGWREAEYLSERTSRWDITDIYCSPLGRAQDTAAASLKKLDRKAVTCDWLKEFDSPIVDPQTGKQVLPWDRKSDYLNTHPELFDLDGWHQSPDMISGNLKENYEYVTAKMDELLVKYGYRRDGYRYLTEKNTHRDDVVVCFCHLGITGALVSHLINVTPHQLWQGFFLAPTSVTVLGTEERTPGEAYFRCQMMGDTSHLLLHSEPVSVYGSFTDPFQG
ncbi:histidine phosphatase family protein [Blautia liquoris]|uniref:Histidine phosphatase family protein n=1 Tax=Blautia liquoris TaxID=2779518 RepID=A0A7M2RFJ4_9FIRM|nr:histidine phosphatase family protein [Blautia liquoris]QOV19115.1 histidine phosphatase family protein [Blautia liquoris]